MAYLAGETARTAMQATVDDEPGTQARAHRHEDGVVRALGGAPRPLGEHTGVGVVHEAHRHTETSPEG